MEERKKGWKVQNKLLEELFYGNTMLVQARKVHKNPREGIAKK